MFLLAAALLSAHTQAPTQIHWEGYNWTIKSAQSEGPGPNNWDPSNVWVDSQGYLHLRISQTNGQWSCAELWTDVPLGFGSYDCQVQGAVDKLDPNVVFSMFSYQGPSGVKEIDIEFAKWGKPKNKNLWWTVWPNDNEGQKTGKGFNLQLPAPESHSEFVWKADSVYYSLQSLEPSDQVNVPFKWNYSPPNYANQIPQQPMSLRFNLWLFQGKPPTDGRPVEVIVKSFSKTS